MHHAFHSPAFVFLLIVRVEEDPMIQGTVSFRPAAQHTGTGILRKSSGFGVFAEIFSKNIMIPSREIPFFGEAPKRFWAIIGVHSGEFG
jgi:hypothetical protein